MAVFSELDAGEQLNETILKNLTVGDIVKTKSSYNKLFANKFIPTNSLSECMIDRMIYLSFKARFVSEPDLAKGESKANDGLKEWLRKDGRSQFLTWIIKGAIKWYEGMGVLQKNHICTNLTYILNSSAIC